MSVQDQNINAGISFSIYDTLDSDNFQISGIKLQSKVMFDYEEKNTFDVGIKASSSGGYNYIKILNIVIVDNEDVNSLSLSNNSIEENLPSGTLVGLISTDNANANTNAVYNLSSSASYDNESFQIKHDSLYNSVSFNYEDRNEYIIEINASSSGFNSVTDTIMVYIADAPDIINDITLSDTTINENQSPGEVIGHILVDDELDSATHTLSILEGGSLFEIRDDVQIEYLSFPTVDIGYGSYGSSTYKTTDGGITWNVVSAHSMLLSLTEFDYEIKNKYSVTVRAISSNGGYSLDKKLDIYINDLPDEILDISLSDSIVKENQNIGTQIGSFVVNDLFTTATHTLSLVNGEGSNDNSSFTILGNNIYTQEMFDYELKDIYSIRVKAESSNGGYFLEKHLNIYIQDLPDEITDITLSNSSIDENEPINTSIGYFDANDKYISATHGFFLVSGEGDNDNSKFYISGSIPTLYAKSSLDYESKNSYFIRVQAVSSNGGYTLEKKFTISVNNLPDNITDITLSSDSVDENESIGTVVGILIADDELVSATHTFKLTSGAGSFDNSLFDIINNHPDGPSLVTNAVFDYESKTEYSIRIKATSSNGGYTYSKQFTIIILDDQTDDCNSSLPFLGSINEGAFPGFYETADSTKPDISDYKIIALPFQGYSLSDLTDGMRSDQYKLKEWNANGYFDSFGFADRGKGYMFISKLFPQNITATYNECLPSLTINMVSEWTMIGNPYLEQLKWSKIEADNGFTGEGFVVWSGGWNSQTTLSQLRGAFINSNDLSANSILLNNPKFNSAEEEFTGKRYNQIEGEEWLLDLELKGGKIHHKISQLGQRADASNNRDRYDLSMLPSLDKAFNIRFDMNTTRDIRRAGDQDITWLFTVENEYSAKATLRWSLQSSPQSNLYLLDTETGDLINMLSKDAYVFSGNGERSFKIIKGSYAYIAEQTGRIVGGYRLYPNPTREYLYVESYAKLKVDDIRIYTIDGKEVVPVSSEIIKSDDLSQITKVSLLNIKIGTYLVKVGDNAKVFIIN